MSRTHRWPWLVVLCAALISCSDEPVDPAGPQELAAEADMGRADSPPSTIPDMMVEGGDMVVVPGGQDMAVGEMGGGGGVDMSCGAGQVFDQTTMRCVQQAPQCDQADQIVGICVPPYDRFGGFDWTSAEAMDRASNNDDRASGGTPTSVPSLGQGMSFAASGEIDAPIDLDGDGKIDQDLDSFRFSGVAGQQLEISLVSATGRPVAFVVRGPLGDYERYSRFGQSRTARTVTLTRDGVYTLSVAPSGALADRSGTFLPEGGEEGWEYGLRITEAGSLALDPGLEAQTMVMGDVATPGGVVFGLGQESEATLLRLTDHTAGAGVTEAVFELWGEGGAHLGTLPLRSMPEAMAATPQGRRWAQLTWVGLGAGATDVSASFATEPIVVLSPAPRPAPIPMLVTLPANSTTFFTFSVPAYSFWSGTLYSQGFMVQASLIEQGGEVAIPSIITTRQFTHEHTRPGQYLVRVETGDNETAVGVTLETLTPQALGAIGHGERLSAVNAEITGVYTFSTNAAGKLLLDFTFDSPFDDSTLELWDDEQNLVFEHSSDNDNLQRAVLDVTADSFYLFSRNPRRSYDTAFAMRLVDPAHYEREPNDTSMQANPLQVAGGSVEGSLAPLLSDQDFYTFTVTTAAVYDVRVQGDCHAASLYDSGGVLLEELVNERALLPPATYVVAVAQDNCFGRNAPTYTLEVSPSAVVPAMPFDQGGNDSQATAQSVGALPQQGPLLTGIIESAGDRDWYRINVPAARDHVILRFGASVPGYVNRSINARVSSATGGQVLLGSVPGIVSLPAGDLDLEVTLGANARPHYAVEVLDADREHVTAINRPFFSGSDQMASYPLTVSGPCTLTSLTVQLGIVDPFWLDGTIELISPSGTSAILRNTRASDDIFATYPTLDTPVEPLTVFHGEEAQGTWTLRLTRTNSISRVGTMVFWGMDKGCQ